MFTVQNVHCRHTPHPDYVLYGSQELSPDYVLYGSQELSPDYVVYRSQELSPDYVLYGSQELSPDDGSSLQNGKWWILAAFYPFLKLNVRWLACRRHDHLAFNEIIEFLIKRGQKFFEEGGGGVLHGASNYYIYSPATKMGHFLDTKMKVTWQNFH